MRTASRDREDVYVAQRLPSVPEIDENGYETGTMLPQFDTSIKYRLRVQSVTEDADIRLYGAESVSMLKIVESPLLIDRGDISYLDPVWVGRIPTGYTGVSGHGKNYINPAAFTAGYRLIETTGMTTVDALQDVTPLIAILGSTNYTLSGATDMYATRVCFYTSTGIFVSGTLLNAGSFTGVPLTVNSPSNAAYVRISTNKISGTALSLWQMELGIAATAYEAYTTTIPVVMDNNYVVCVQPIQTPRQTVIMLKSVIANG